MPEDGGHALPQSPNRTSKTRATIATLAKLLNDVPAAEELTHTWQRGRGQSIQHHGPRLHDLRKAFDAGQSIDLGGDEAESRGIPMWIVVRMCKATWHQDGTWPLLGADEAMRAGERAGESLVRSIHPSAALLRPPGVTCFQPPADASQGGPALRMEPSAEEIAASYRKRGVEVAEAEHTPASDDW